MTTQPAQTGVLIAGAGPVGLVLAMELAARGIDVTVLEPRQRLEPPNVKCNHVSARSMEILRRLGVAGAVRQAGLPADYPHDIAYRTTATGQERSEEHTSELQSLMRISYAVFCLKKKNTEHTLCVHTRTSCDVYWHHLRLTIVH